MNSSILTLRIGDELGAVPTPVTRISDQQICRGLNSRSGRTGRGQNILATRFVLTVLEILMVGQLKMEKEKKMEN